MSFSTKLAKRVATLAFAATSILALQGPVAADAAITTTPNGNVLTIKGDGANDLITLSVTGAQPVIAVNGQATTEPAGANTEIVVESGAGIDAVNAGALATTDYKSLVIDGGEGNDTLTGGGGGDSLNGGEGNDLLNGGAGNDTLVGGKGTDDDSGGAGDDVMVWNNGDGNDVNEGNDGTDESVFNGATAAPNNADAITVAPITGGGSLIHRTAPTNIEITVTADTEKVSVNGLAGDDTLAGATGDAGLIALTLSGGEGSDTLTGGDGADTLNGDAGNDTLTGFKGTDLDSGGAGDDVMVWNNGDGNDRNNGGDGTDESVFNGATAAPNNADAITVAPIAGGGSLIHRTAPTNIEITVTADTEKVAVNGLAGDDTLSGSTGLAGHVALTLGGGEGNDQLTGGDGADTLNGDAGNDTLTGAAGKDVLSGGQGNDQLFARDGQADIVSGGADVDSAQTDQRTLDQISEVENVDATGDKKAGNGDKVALLPHLGKVTVAGSGKHLIAKVPVACPAGESSGCSTTLTVETAKGHRRVLGTKAVKLGAATKTTAAIRLSPRAAVLAVRGRLAVRIQVKTTDGAGNTAAHTVSTTLRVPRR